MAVGCWRRSPGLILAGLLVVVAGWSRGLLHVGVDRAEDRGGGYGVDAGTPME